MNDVILSFLSLQDQRTLMVGDTLNFGLLCFLLHWHTKKEILPKLPEDETKQKVEKLFGLMTFIGLIVFGLVCLCNLVVSIGFIPCIINESTNKTNMNLFILVFYIVCIFRLFFIMGSVFFLFYFFKFEEKDRARQIVWIGLILVSLLINLICLFYFMVPRMKSSLVLYRAFYDIRNLFIEKDPKKQKKISEVLKEMTESFNGSIPGSLVEVYEKQWSCTFKNQVRFL